MRSSDWSSDVCSAELYGRADKVRPVYHEGTHFRVDGPLTMPRPPQGNPVLFQAGASDQGRDLAARRAEAIYAVAYDLPSAQAYYRDIRRRMQAAGRREIGRASCRERVCQYV